MALLIGDLARVDTPPILQTAKRGGGARAHIASASVSRRDKIKFLDGGLVLRPNTLGRRRERKRHDNINWQDARHALLMIICTPGTHLIVDVNVPKR